MFVNTQRLCNNRELQQVVYRIYLCKHQMHENCVTDEQPFIIIIY